MGKYYIEYKPSALSWGVFSKTENHKNEVLYKLFDKRKDAEQKRDSLNKEHEKKLKHGVSESAIKFGENKKRAHPGFSVHYTVKQDGKWYVNYDGRILNERISGPFHSEDLAKDEVNRLEGFK